MLLLPGWSDTRRALAPCRDYLVGAGWAPERVHCGSFTDPYGSNVDHAAEIAAMATALRAATGAARIAVVAHSMGGLALRRYLADGGAEAVHTAVFAGTPHAGTWAAWLGWGAGAREMRPGSRFLRELSATSLPAGVRLICVRTPIDTHVVPGASAFLAGAECHTVRMPIHQRLLRHEQTLRLVRDLLAAGPRGSHSQA